MFAITGEIETKILWDACVRARLATVCLTHMPTSVWCLRMCVCVPFPDAHKQKPFVITKTIKVKPKTQKQAIRRQEANAPHPQVRREPYQCNN